MQIELAVKKNITNIYKLLKGVVTNPSRIFKEILAGAFKNETLLVFATVTALSFLKSGGLSGVSKVSISFYSSDKLNYLFTLLSISQVNWLITFASYFILIFLIFFIYRFFSSPKIRPLFLSLMAISVIGLIFQVLTILFRYFIPHIFLNYLIYFVYVWILMLTVLAVKTCTNSSFFKSGLVLIIAAIPVVLLVGLLGVAPYLIGLSA